MKKKYVKKKKEVNINTSHAVITVLESKNGQKENLWKFRIRGREKETVRGNNKKE
jgi:hypothetical protein